MTIVSKQVIDRIDLKDFETVYENSNIEPESKKSRHYVDNKQLYQEFCKWYEQKLKNDALGLPRPKLSDKIGLAIMQIAKRRANYFKWNKYSVSWKEEMIQRAIEHCVAYCNFDPTLYNNPFSYLTQICNHAIIQQIKIEKKQLYIRYKSMLNHDSFFADLDENMDAVDFPEMADNDTIEHMRTFVQLYEERNLSHVRKTREAKEDVDTVRFDDIDNIF